MCLNDGQQFSSSYMCHVCEKVYCQGSTLSKHLKKVHNIELTSGHSRFRYKLETDGFYRLQTMRYESLELFELLNKKDSAHTTAAIPEETDPNSDCVNIETTESSSTEKMTDSTEAFVEKSDTVDFNELILENEVSKPQKIIFNAIESMEKDLVSGGREAYESPEQRTPVKSSNEGFSSQMCSYNPDVGMRYEEFDTSEGDVNQSFLMQLETPKKINSSVKTGKTNTYAFFMGSSSYE